MSAELERLRLPTPTQYYEAASRVDGENTDIYEFIEKIGDGARALPKDLKITLGLLARKGIPHEEDRPSRLRACRALAYGASLAVMLGEAAHEWPGVMKELSGFDITGFEGETPEDNIFEMHGVINELVPVISESTIDWLRKRADNTAMAGEIEDGYREWFMIGAAQVLAMLYSNAVMQNK